jgi:hypothetical protein
LASGVMRMSSLSDRADGVGIGLSFSTEYNQLS